MVVYTLTGNHAVAYAVKAARVQVIAAYPITPQTTIVEKLAEMIERGELDAEMIRVESEHSALAAVYGAALMGARVFTATASHGLLYMHEVLWWVAGSRIPIVMAIATRAIGPPWNIHTDHNDILDQRDTGWIIAMAENNQEVFDLTLLAFRISEDIRVQLPVMVGLDGFVLTHTTEPVDVPDQSVIDSWLPARRQLYTIEPGKPLSIGNPVDDEVYEEMRMDIQRAMLNALKVIEEAGSEYERLTGRRYGLVECYKCSDADIIAIGIGAWMGDLKVAINKLREEGIKIGLAKLWFVRPYPCNVIRDITNGKKLVIVFDRSISLGNCGQLFMDTSACINTKTSMVGVVAGIGGVDVSVEDFLNIVKSIVREFESEGWIYKPLLWYHSGRLYDLYTGGNPEGR